MAKTMPWERGPAPEKFKEPEKKGIAEEMDPRPPVLAPLSVPKRTWFALHAPAPPAYWKVRVPADLARWAWAWADAMLLTEAEPTAPEQARPPVA